MKTFKRSDTDILSKWWWTVDKISLMIILILISIGIFIMSSASLFMAERFHTGSLYFAMRHLVFLVFSFSIIILLSFTDQKTITRIAIIGFLITFILLFMVCLFGHTNKGAKRWIKILKFSLQPSEFIKPFFAVTNAWLLSIMQNETFALLTSVSLLLSPLFFLIIQPDIGMSVVLISIWLAQIFVYGIKIRLVSILMIILMITGVIVYLSFSHVKNRVDTFISKSTNNNYQVKKSLESFQKGGLFGVGPAEGKVKLHLPDAHTDFIFAVIGEELGIISCIFIISLFALLIYRFYNNTIKKNDVFIFIAVSGLLVQLGSQVFINIGTNIKILPAKGMTLPFISYGGSSALSTGIVFGILLSLSRRTFNIKKITII